MNVIVGKPGPLTTVQDAGRVGWRHLGVARAGAMDTEAAELANALVGNPPDAAVLEFTLRGPTLELPLPARIAVVGAVVDMAFDTLDGESHVLRSGRRIELPAGVLRLGAIRDGNRAWFAVAGGIATVPVLGSRSTDLRGGFGGVDGRSLMPGDVLAVGPVPGPDVTTPRMGTWWVDPGHEIPVDAPIRYVPPPHDAAHKLSRQPWTVTPRSNRQGVRLEGIPLPTARGEEISTAVAPGSIQLPPDGLPIVLLADAQTTGGYPRLGHIVAADLTRFAQRRPGQTVRFQPCTPTEAIELWRSKVVAHRRLLAAIRVRLR